MYYADSPSGVITMKNNIFAIFIAAFLLIATCVLVVAALNGGEVDVETEEEEETTPDYGMPYQDDNICVSIELDPQGDRIIIEAADGESHRWAVYVWSEDVSVGFAYLDSFKGDEISFLFQEDGIYLVSFSLAALPSPPNSGAGSIWYIIDVAADTVTIDEDKVSVKI